LKKYIILLLITALYLNVLAQNTDAVFELQGKIIDSNSKKPVPFAHIINAKKGQATVSDTAGYFKILMLRNDTIKISCVGYEVGYFWLIDNFDDKKQELTILLVPKIYNIKQINVYEERLKNFAYEFENTEIEQDKTKKRLETLIQNMIPQQEIMLIGAASRGIGFPINYKTRRDKSLEKVEELKRQDELNKLAEQKFNKDLVKKITGLDGTQLDDFYTYCKFDRDFILQRNEYDLIIIVKELFDIYKEEKM